MLSNIKLAIAVVVMSLVFCGQALALQYGFYNITNNNSVDAGIGEAQLKLDVDLSGDNNEFVDFKFSNTGPAPSVIEAVYFDDGSIIDPFSVFDTGGNVLFSQILTPNDLPGGGEIGFETTSYWKMDADPAAPFNGVGPGEFLTIRFNVLSGQNVYQALADESLRIGIHVIAFESGGSESFVNSVPDASIMFLLGPALLALGALGRKKYLG